MLELGRWVKEKDFAQRWRNEFGPTFPTFFCIFLPEGILNLRLPGSCKWSQLIEISEAKNQFLFKKFTLRMKIILLLHRMSSANGKLLIHPAQGGLEVMMQR